MKDKNLILGIVIALILWYFLKPAQPGQVTASLGGTPVSSGVFN